MGELLPALPVSLLLPKKSCCKVVIDPIAFEMVPESMFKERSTTSTLLKVQIGSSGPGSFNRASTEHETRGIDNYCEGAK